MFPVWERRKGYFWVFPKIGVFTPKMDGLFHGKPYVQIDDLGGFTTPIFSSTPIYLMFNHFERQNLC